MKIDGCVVDGFFQSGILYYSERGEWILDLLLCACMHACEMMDGIPSPALAGNLSVSYESWFCMEYLYGREVSGE